MGRIDGIIINTCHLVVHIVNIVKCKKISLQFMSHQCLNGILERILIGEGMHANEMASEIT